VGPDPAARPFLARPRQDDRSPVKDYISQNAIFTLCIIGLAEGAFFAWQKGNRHCALAFVLLAIAFFANILYATVSRTALLALPILLFLFAFRRLGWKSAAGLAMATMISLAVAWPTSAPCASALRSYST
jgi:O-antigen ligase